MRLGIGGCTSDLSAYDFSLKYRSGLQNIDADGLSRIPRKLSCEQVSAWCQGQLGSVPFVETLCLSHQVLHSLLGGEANVVEVEPLDVKALQE